MPFPVAFIALTVAQGGASPAAQQAAVAAVPVPEAQLTFLGAQVVLDMTVAGPPTVRTFGILLVPLGVATATPKLLGSVAGSPIESVTVTARGSGYVTAPVAVVTDPQTAVDASFFQAPQQGRGAHLQAYLRLHGSSITPTTAGTGYSASTIAAFVGGFPLGSGALSHPPPLQGAVPPAGAGRPTTRTSDARLGPMNVGSVGMIAKGRRYNATTIVQFLGPFAPGGRQAQGVPIVDVGGRILGVQITDPGAGYIRAPKVVFVDPTGTGVGAKAGASMVRGTAATGHVTLGGGGSIASIVIDTPGDGYVLPPSVVIFDPTGAGSGATATANMEVSRVDVLAGGQGYVKPSIDILGVFETMFLNVLVNGTPATIGDTLLPFTNFMVNAIQNAVSAPCTATIPA